MQIPNRILATRSLSQKQTNPPAFLNALDTRLVTPSQLPQGPSLWPEPMKVIGTPCSLIAAAELGVELGRTP